MTAHPILQLSGEDFVTIWRGLNPKARSAMPLDVIGECMDRLRVWEKDHPPEKKNGHSLGEFSAVTNASAIMRATPEPVRYCVGGRVPSGLVIIGGRPKAKKSWYALQLAIAKSTGGRFMHMMATQCRCLYVALEDNDRRMRKRLEFFGIGQDSGPDRLNIAYEWPTGLEGIEKLERWLYHFPDTGLVIIDVLERFRGRRDPKMGAYEADYQSMAQLHAVTQRHPHLTILVVHHVKKGAVEDPIEALNGTFAIAGGADAFIILRKGGEKEQWIAHVDGRDWESWDHEFLWEFVQQEGWRQIGLSDGIMLTDLQRGIVDFAKKADGGYVTPTRLSEWREIGKSSAHEALTALVSKGALRVYAGKYYPVSE